MDMFVFSPSKNLIYPVQLMNSYVDAGTWPGDAVAISDSMGMEFINPAPAGKVRVVENGLPVWSDIPPPTADELIATAKAKQQALINEAASIIAPMKDALDGDYIDDTDKPKLIEWQKYRYELTKVDPANPAWPKKPE